MKHATRLSEGRKMFISVMVIFFIYAIIFILFEDYDRTHLMPFAEASDWHLLLFSLFVMAGLAVLLYRYAHRMDERISREQAEKENRMRRELTQNIAHELKTPTSSILGFTETILSTPGISEADKELFIRRTHAQAQRLSALLTDISILNRMDYPAETFSMERIDVSLIVADIVAETALAVKSQGMTLRNCLPGDIIIRGNTTLVYSIFRNLVDNSVNYAGQGSTIELLATEDDESWHFTFSDNGIGIAEEHLPRIFERFYRIDKGRSRSLGGTGLGLSIVKNAVVMHGGSITAHNNAGGNGLTFSFSLKKG